MPNVKSWPPLESNPDAFNQFAREVGIGPSKASFHDCYGLSDDMLDWILQPCEAVIVLFPLNDKVEDDRKQFDAQHSGTEHPDIFFCKQRIRNACGTFALLHALGNAPFAASAEGPLGDLVRACKGKTPEERAALVETSDELERIHGLTASEGQTAELEAGADVDYHFVTFIERNGHVFELDGRRVAPVDHGPISRDFLHDTAAHVSRLLEVAGDIMSMITMSPE